MTITIPENAVLFRVKSGFWHPPRWMKWEKTVLKLLKVPDAYKQELSRLLVANCYTTGSYLICNFEAFYSVARLLFSLSKKAKKEDWPIVSQATQQSPRVICEALGLKVYEWYSEEQFFVFKVDGVSAQFAGDIAVLGRIAAKFAKNQVNNDQLKLELK